MHYWIMDGISNVSSAEVQVAGKKPVMYLSSEEVKLWTMRRHSNRTGPHTLLAIATHAKHYDH